MNHKVTIEFEIVTANGKQVSDSDIIDWMMMRVKDGDFGYTVQTSATNNYGSINYRKMKTK